MVGKHQHLERRKIELFSVDISNIIEKIFDRKFYLNKIQESMILHLSALNSTDF